MTARIVHPEYFDDNEWINPIRKEHMLGHVENQLAEAHKEEWLRQQVGLPEGPLAGLLRFNKRASDRQAGGQHYKNFTIQPAEYCQRNKLPFIESCVVKYVSRHAQKGKAKDIKKAIHMLELLLEYEYNDTYTQGEEI